MHHHADDFGRRVELATLLPGAVGKVLDQVLVSSTQQVRELEVVVRQRDLIEVLNEFDQNAVVHRPLADLAIEVNRLQRILQRIRVGILNRSQRLV